MISVMKVLIATQKPFAKAASEGICNILHDAGLEAVLLERYEDVSQLMDAVKDADALIVRSDKVTDKLLAAAPKLKIVVRAGAGYDNVDLQAASEHGIVVENTPGQNANAVAELVIALMIFMARNQFTPVSGSEIMGKTLGLQAFGHVARLVASKAMALGMKVKATDPFVPVEFIREAGVEPVSDVADLYKSCDYVSVHIPATPTTIGSIGTDLIGSMPKGGVLINTARKEIVDEQALENVLAQREDLKYAADVAPDNISTLRERFGTRVFVTPKKMGAQTAEANLNAGIAAARQIVTFFKDGIAEFRVNK